MSSREPRFEPHRRPHGLSPARASSDRGREDGGGGERREHGLSAHPGSREEALALEREAPRGIGSISGTTAGLGALVEGSLGLDVLILRDPRESVRKCSLTPLRGLPGIRFVDYRPDRVVDAGERVLLHPDGEDLRPADGALGLLVVDCAWRRVDALLRTVRGTLHARRLPPLATAYPRRSRTFTDPASGLASVEALYAALVLTGRHRPDLLDAYRWRDEFLAANPALARGDR